MDDQGPPKLPPAGGQTGDQRLAALEAEVIWMRGQMLRLDKAASDAEWAVNAAARTEGRLGKLLEQLEHVRDETGLRFDRLALRGFAYMKKMDAQDAAKSRRVDRFWTVLSVLFFIALFINWLARK